jgi:translocation and assembly module TamB
LKGQIEALWKEKFPFHFDGEFSRLNVAELDWMRAEAGGTLHIFGDMDAAHINAQAAILESDLSIPERLPLQLPNLQVKYINAPKPVAVEAANTAHRQPYPIFLDLHIYAPSGVFVSGRGLNSEWKGNFQLGGTFTDIEAKGQLELMDGEFLFSGRGFKLTEGSITFTGKPHEMPWINLAGHMQLQDLDILARLKGPLTSPQLAFQSIPPLPMGSILANLLFGQDLSEINALQAVKIVNSLATFSPDNPNLLSGTRRSLGIDRLRIIATPTSDEGAQSIALQVGKYVTRGVLVSVSQGFEGGSANLSVEVDLTNGFVFQAESQQEQEQGKFTIKWNLNY